MGQTPPAPPPELQGRVVKCALFLENPNSGWTPQETDPASLPHPPMEPLPESEPLAALSPCLPAHCPVPSVL